MQATLSNGKRPDCLIKLPNPPGPIVIDSKFPLESYRALRAAADDAARAQAERQLRAHVLKHVHDIAERYLIPGETADYALMFLPSEAVYAEIHANFQDVVEKSHQKKVAIVSPTTMWAALNTVRAVFKDVRMREPGRRHSDRSPRPLGGRGPTGRAHRQPDAPPGDGRQRPRPDAHVPRTRSPNGENGSRPWSWKTPNPAKRCRGSGGAVAVGAAGTPAFGRNPSRSTTRPKAVASGAERGVAAPRNQKGRRAFMAALRVPSSR